MTLTIPPLWHTQKDRLRTWLAHERVGIITDMDGTLSPIVPVPDDARPTSDNRDALAQLHRHLPLVAVVSGRAAADVRAKVDLPQLVYAGNHGLERWVTEGEGGGQVVASPLAQPYLPALQTIKAQVEADTPPEIWVEDKTVTLSIHYRAHANPAQFRDQYHDRIASRVADAGLKLFEGRMIFEVRPPIDINKGTIFANLIEEYALDAACFIGDDVTDTDAFIMARRLRQQDVCDAIAIGVASPGDDTPQSVLDNSDLFTSGVDDVASLLAWLLSELVDD